MTSPMRRLNTVKLTRFIAFALAALAAPVAVSAQTETVYYFHTDAN
jgi:hypothetical protein